MRYTKETNTGRVGMGKYLQTSLYDIESKATKDKNHKFQNLYILLNKRNLEESWKWMNKRASSGIDNQSAKEFEKNISKELKQDKYKAKLVKRVYIEKSNGGKRPLGIPTVRDKLLQTLCSRILEAIYEPKFIKTSFGYRRSRGAKDAVKRLGKELNFGKYIYVVEADIKGFFDNMSHDLLIQMLEYDISDKRIIKLIRKWLKAGVINSDKSIESPIKGTPQGGVISPVLANIYLHYALDNWFENAVAKQVDGESKIIRYADDFVCAFRYKRDAERFMSALETRLKRFNLELAKDKTKLIRFSRFSKEKNEDFDFLGFTFRWEVSRKGKDIITHKTSKKKFKKSVENLKTWIKENRNCRLRKLFEKLNSKLRGYYNYYGIIGNSYMLNKFHNIVIRLLYKWMNRRSQRRSFNWQEFARKIRWYGIIRPFIRKESGQVVFEI